VGKSRVYAGRRVVDIQRAEVSLREVSYCPGVLPRPVGSGLEEPFGHQALCPASTHCRALQAAAGPGSVGAARSGWEELARLFVLSIQQPKYLVTFGAFPRA